MNNKPLCHVIEFVYYFNNPVYFTSWFFFTFNASIVFSTQGSKIRFSDEI